MKPEVKTALLLILFLAIFSAVATAESITRYRVDVSARNDTGELMRTLEREGFDVAGRNPETGTVEVIVSVSQMRLLADMGYDFRVKATTGRGIPPGYRNFTTILAQMQAWENAYPAIAKSVDVGAMTGVGNTYEGRVLQAIKISDNVNADEDEPSIMIVSCHHAREITTPELALYAIEEILSNYGTDPEITRFVDENEIWIAPVWNPDGYDYCFTTYDYWRKNRTPVGSGYYGVDLNRNYPYGWNGPAGGSTHPGSDTYKGPSAASEQETQTMMALALDRHFAKVLDFHSYGRELLYAYYYSSSMPTAIENYLSSEATSLSSAMGYHGDKRKPSAEGEHYQWELNELGAYSFLAETGTSFQPSYNDALYEAQLVWPGIKWFIERKISLKGHITETTTGIPIVADIDIAGINYPEADKHQSEADYGRFHYFLPAGTYTATISASGYPSRTVQVSITAGESTLIETQLGTGPALTVTGKVKPGEQLDLSFDWPSGAGQKYLNGLSLTNQGFTFTNGLFFPIGLDTMLKNTAGFFPGWSGQLDGSGHASAALTIPNNPGLVGATFYMAYLTFTNDWRNPTNASAAVTLVVEN